MQSPAKEVVVDKTGRAPSIHDVAAHAGVSHQTVSRVLNGFVGIRPATRARVDQAIIDLGYRRNLTAWTLATGRSHTIGLVGPEKPDIGPLSSLHAVERAAREAGFHTLTTSSGPEANQIRGALEFMMSRSVDALVVIAQQESVQVAAEDTLGQMPVVQLLSGGQPRDSSVSIDQRVGVEVIMDHLTGLGHSLIQHVAGPLDFAEAIERRDAFTNYVSQHGLVELPVIEADWSSDAGYAAGEHIDHRATAVFCANDQTAFGLMHALADLGRRVPEDISVAGFDDTPEARHSTPPLTTVHQDFERVGQLAVAHLVARLDGVSPPSDVPLVPWLVERSSTGPLRLAGARASRLLNVRD